MKAQLARQASNVTSLLESDNWGMQQKLDGHRLLIHCGETLKGYNRQGDLKKIPANLKAFFEKLTMNWVFDGELIGDKYYVFDLLEVPTGDVRNWPLNKRHEMLTKLESKLPEDVSLVKMITEDKETELETFRQARVEGVVLKNLHAPYKEGKTYNFLKVKFVNDVDCLVLGVNLDNKSNLSLGMFNGKDFVEVGRVSNLTGDGPSVKQGDVVKVTCLYSTDDGRLYQPVKPILRDDKLPSECTIDQLEETKTSKNVLV